MLLTLLLPKRVEPWIPCTRILWSALLSFTFLSPSIATSTFKLPVDENTILLHACPGTYDDQDPWHPDEEDCACYYVCDGSGGAVRMCCHEGLWWHQESKTCLYMQDFSRQHFDRCIGLVRGIGTTGELREIFLGRCWEYQRFINPDAFQDGYRDCQSLFDSFAKAFVGLAPCKDVGPEAYKQLIEEATLDLPRDSQLFWSGVYSLAQSFANRGHRMYTLESTLIGYILNDVTWCGQTESPGINFETCPAFASCEKHVMASFWAQALELYAAQAEGVVTVLLNGSRVDGYAYRNNSFFAGHELPSLDPEKVSLFRVWVAHDLDRPPTETCASGSLSELESIAKERGFKYECMDNPPPILHQLCMDAPYHPKCLFYQGQRLS